MGDDGRLVHDPAGYYADSYQVTIYRQAYATPVIDIAAYGYLIQKDELEVVAQLGQHQGRRPIHRPASSVPQQPHRVVELQRAEEGGLPFGAKAGPGARPVVQQRAKLGPDGGHCRFAQGVQIAGAELVTTHIQAICLDKQIVHSVVVTGRPGSQEGNRRPIR